MAEYTDQNKAERDISDTYAEINRQTPLHAPAALDADILAVAHRAVESKPRPLRTPTYRWAPPLAMAAMLVLTATLVILLPNNEQQHISNNPAPTPETRQKKRASHTTAAVAQQKAPPTIQPMLEPNSIQSRTAMPDLLMIETDDLSPETQEEPPSGLTDSDMQTLLARTPHHNPKEWQSMIEMLLEQGQWEQADKQFKQFEHAWPQHPFVRAYPEKKKTHQQNN